MKTQFIPIDYDSFDFQGRNYVKITGRDEKGKRICLIDDCPVYIWAILKEKVPKSKVDKLIEKISKIRLDSKGRQTKVEKVEIKKKNFLGKEVTALKVFATNYKDLQEIAEKLIMKEIEKRRGYDLGYIRHYTIEKKLSPLIWYDIEGELLQNSEEFGGIDMGLDVDFCIKLNSHTQIKKEKKFIPKTLAFDIETDGIKIGEDEILMVALASENFNKVITWKKSNNDKKLDHVEYVEDEAELIERFVEHVRNISPDFLVGYFSDGFDLPYLKARAEKHNVKLSLNLDDSQPKFSRGASLTAKTKGIVHVDILKFIRTAYSQYMKAETLSLNEVAKEFLGDTKKPFEHKHSSKVKDWEEYYEYNLHDSKLTLQLFEKFWPDLSEFSKIIQEPITEISRAGLSKYTENYILHNLDKFNEIPEKRPSYNQIGERRATGSVEGAFVFDTKPGLYENISIFDFTSMHTSIIISHNISRSTLLDKKESGSYASPIINNKGERKQYFFSKKPGFLPELLKEIFELRKKFKEQHKKDPNQITKARSNAFKVLSASAHGYIGFFGARYYSHEASASILAFVRQFNQETIKKIEDKGYNVIFGDTDSVGFLQGKKSKTEIKKLLEQINKELPGVMKLELEGFFKRGLWVTTRGGTTGAKKKYALIDEEGTMKIRGFETVRRDWCNLARKTQNEILKDVLKEGNEEKALEYLKKVIKRLRDREVEKEEIMIKTQLKKPLSEYKAQGPHVIAAKRMKEQGIPVSQGNLIRYYIAETREKKKLVRDKVKLPGEEGKYEIEYYLNRQILPAVENIFQVFNIDTKELVEGKKQTTLGDF